MAEHDLIVTRAELDDLHDRLYVLEAAMEDAERDLAGGDASAAAYREALDWVLAAARPLITDRLVDRRPTP